MIVPHTGYFKHQIFVKIKSIKNVMLVFAFAFGSLLFYKRRMAMGLEEGCGRGFRTGLVQLVE